MSAWRGPAKIGAFTAPAPRPAVLRPGTTRSRRGRGMRLRFALAIALLGVLLLAAVPAGVQARPQAAGIIQLASGPDPAAIQAKVDAFRADLGGSSNGAAPPAAAGRREINWDGVPDSLSAPNTLPADFF